MRPTLARCGWLCTAHPWRVIGGWIAVLVSAFALAAAIGHQPRGDFDAPESAGQDFLATAFPAAAGADARVVVHAGSRPFTPADLWALRARLQAVGDVVDVSMPRLSGTGDTALLTVAYQVPVSAFHGPQGVDALRDAVAPARRSGLRVELGGQVPEDYTADGGHLERDAVIAVGCLLLVASGSVAAAGIAPAVAMVGVGTGLALLLILAGAVEINTTAPLLGAALGIGVAITDALLFLASFRQQLSLHDDVRDVAAAANGSAGRDIVVAGTAVVVPLLALRTVGVPQFATYGYATGAMVVAVTLAAVTLLPALGGLAGHRLAGRGRRTTRGARPATWAQFVARRPAVCAVAAVSVLVALAIPALGMRTWPRDAASRPTSDTVRRAYDTIATAFGPGANGPITIAVDATAVSPTRLRGTIADLGQTTGVAMVSEPVFDADRSAAVFTVEPSTAPRDPATAQTMTSVRERLTPGMYLGGQTAYFVDVAAPAVPRLWLSILVVVGLAAVVLALAYGAPVVAMMAALMRLLALAATYGVLVAAFQWGWGATALGLPGAAPISTWAAVLVFVVVFGLTATYETVTVSRLRSVGHVTAVVTAAMVVIAFFLAFALDPDVIIQMTCVGVAIGLFIDVLVVRLVLLPAGLALLGRRENT